MLHFGKVDWLAQALEIAHDALNYAFTAKDHTGIRRTKHSRFQ
jgi:hypothetical protein